ncbi:outer membrane protein [Arcobacter roscoffensis]|uniref:Porin family protein n=1 Tax=Arcobacter roscoffensis TaxID=2961520 RepID=A0ABY5E4L3_9BACT|nr:outer membrane beta-barrel protein [Arcobacter roscoffensis]UTJ06115.1 porin family protein [Arcobacter roscoffensis]
MKKILISTISSTLLVTSLSANSSEKNLFASIQYGFTHINNDKKDTAGTVSLIEEQDSSSESVNLEFGYEYSKNIDLSVNYQLVSSDDVDLNNIYLQSKYKFENKNFTPYVGAILGYSELKWNKAPINTLNNDTKSSSYIVGANAGILYPMSNSTDLVLNYTLAYMGHKAELSTTSTNNADLKHDLLNTVSFGIRFNF